MPAPQRPDSAHHPFERDCPPSGALCSGHRLYGLVDAERRRAALQGRAPAITWTTWSRRGPAQRGGGVYFGVQSITAAAVCHSLRALLREEVAPRAPKTLCLVPGLGSLM